MKALNHKHPGGPKKGQSLIEFALGGLLLVMILAASVDFGRAYYTYVVVQNMAAEGAEYISDAPDADMLIDASHPDDTFQGRARNVGVRAMGGIITPDHVRLPDDVTVDVSRANRCYSTGFQVSVAYHMDDLFFPALVGVRSLTIGATAPSAFKQSTGAIPNNCP